MDTIGSFFDPVTIWVNLLLSASAWLADAELYTGSRRQWRINRAIDLSNRARAIELAEAL